MKAEPVVGVQPSVIRWARESMGMSIEDVAHKLKKSSEEVMAWESEDGASPNRHAKTRQSSPLATR
ncbi:MAG: helix-turn-helix domain-containing protein [Polaromonas sp.]